MASTTKTTPPPLFLLVVLLLSITATTKTTEISTGTLDGILSLLRINGQSLFANAITTSDLLFDLLSLSSFTLLSPPDPQLFALGMTSPTLLSYLSSLRLHVIPNSSLPLLARLPHNASLLLHTLLPSRDLHVTRGEDGVLRVDGVGVVFPRLYYSRDVSIYLLRGVLPSEHVVVPRQTRNGTVIVTPPPMQDFNVTPSCHNNNNCSNCTGFAPIPVNRTGFVPPPPPVNRRAVSHPALGAPSPVKAGFAVIDAPAESPRRSGGGGVGPTVEVKMDEEEGKCGPLDGYSRMQCAATDDNRDGSGTRHI